MKMSEKLCLQWDDFGVNVRKSLEHLRTTTDFADVTLACEDGHQIEAHKIILAASSHFFQNILKTNKHSHPLIFMRGVKSEELSAIIDYLYCGEASINQEDLESFLKIAQELQLDGLGCLQEQDEIKGDSPLNLKDLKSESTETKHNISLPPLQNPKQTKSRNQVPSVRKADSKGKTTNGIKMQISKSAMATDEQELDETVKSMMETSENMFPMGKKKTRGRICKVCRKEGHPTDIMRHIEAYHLEGIAISCNFCGKTLRSRHTLRHHIKVHHTQQIV